MNTYPQAKNWVRVPVMMFGGKIVLAALAHCQTETHHSASRAEESWAHTGELNYKMGLSFERSFQV